MSKSSRKRNADVRRNKKRAAKAAKRALYASYAGTGRRAKKQGRKAEMNPQRGNHAMLICGNVGCERCFPQFRAVRQNETV